MKKLLLFLVTGVLLLFNSSAVFAADKDVGNICDIGTDTCCQSPKSGMACQAGKSYSCKFSFIDAKTNQAKNTCQEVSPIEKTFGQIQAPDALAKFLQNDPTGAGALSQFLSNLIALIFAMATIVLVFMIIWGAFDWLISEGDKEKISAAQKKIISAFVGFILLAIAFAILRIFGQFTGFTFFEGQNGPTLNQRIQQACPNGPPCPP